MKHLAAQVREENFKKQASAKPAPKPVKEPNARERALMFAKNVPKPDVPKQNSSKQDIHVKPSSKKDAKPQNPELAQLEEQHCRDQQKVDAIRAELARMLL